MITQLIVKNVATYTKPTTLHDLRKINFVFGSNGSGKTTIGRAIEQAEGHSDCVITWSGGTPLEVMVYNSDFVDRNFNLSSPLRGDFTLGENQVQAEAEISTLRPQVEEQINRIKGINTNLDGSDQQVGKRQELLELENAFREKAWRQKQKHDDYFQNAFTGVRGNQENFKSKVLYEITNNSAKLFDLEYLKAKAKTVYASNQQQANSLPIFNFEELLALESNTILLKPIVGSQDVSIAALINKLGNADWVKQGLHFHDEANGTCPFCQQPTSTEFANELKQFFDDAYQSDLQEVANLKSKYESAKNSINAGISSVKQAKSEFLDNALFSAEAGLLEELLVRNLQIILNKTQEPI